MSDPTVDKIVQKLYGPPTYASPVASDIVPFAVGALLDAERFSRGHVYVGANFQDSINDIWLIVGVDTAAGTAYCVSEITAEHRVWSLEVIDRLGGVQ